MDVLDGEEGPKTGDYVFSIGKTGIGTRYLVIESYRVKRRDPQACPRYQMKVEVVTESEIKVSDIHSGAVRLFEFKWYPRKRRSKISFEQFMRRRVE